jgi:hypothetical protein
MRDETPTKNRVSDHTPAASIFIIFFLCPVLILCLFLLVWKKLSWSKTIVRKWFNIKTKAKDLHSDYGVEEGTCC